MTAKQGKNAAERAVEAIRRHEPTNGHSWGVAAEVDGELVIDKGVGRVPEDYEPPESTNVVAHTRYATRGTIDETNAHPFAIENGDDEVVAALAHNGTWYDAPDVPGKCDSRFIAERIEEQLAALSLEMAVKIVAQYVGETILVIACDGTVYAYSGRFDITMEPDESAIASSGLNEDIPKGRMVKMQ